LQDVLLPVRAHESITKVNSIFARAETQSDFEVQSDYAKYLVIRVCGLVEQVVLEIIQLHTSSRSNPRIANHVVWRMGMFQNPNIEKLLQLAGSFDKTWRAQLEKVISEEERIALSSITAQRNRIAHGGDSTISLGQVRQYYSEVLSLVEKFADPF
jgi:hypothetical protein